MFSLLWRTANWLFFKTKPFSWTAWFGHCRASKCPFHMSINRTCAAHRGVYITNRVQTVYLLHHCRAYIGGACESFNRSVDSCNKILPLTLQGYRTPYSSYYPIKNKSRVVRSGSVPRNWSAHFYHSPEMAKGLHTYCIKTQKRI